ncbi:MAG: sugar phosphate isomerase/epimerase [Bacteroidales bacterium]|nr:sugar phosphate isomerase/epimerase [Bacteroidales bacterium]
MNAGMVGRRDFLASASAVALAGCVAGTRAPMRAASGRPRFHVFSKMFQPPVTASPEALCDLLAAAGCDGVQWTVRKGGHATPENAARELPRLVEIARSRGLGCESICTAIVDGDDSAAETVCRAAAGCGITQLRTGYLFYDDKRESFHGSMDRFKRTFASLARLGERTGMKLAYQNHSTWGPPIFGGVVWDVHECIRDLDPRWIGLEYDPMHACFETGGSWKHSFALMAPWISAVDLKDFRYRMDPKRPGQAAKEMVAAGKGVVPWADVRRLVETHGVDPLYIVHFEYDFDKSNLPRTVRAERDAFARVLGGG